MNKTHGPAFLAPNRKMVSGSAILANAAQLIPTARREWGKIPKHVAHNLLVARVKEERSAIVAEARARCAAFKPGAKFEVK